MTAKSAPYPPCTVTAFWLKYQDPDRCFRRVTQPPHIAGPLGAMGRLSANLIASLKLIPDTNVVKMSYNNRYKKTSHKLNLPVNQTQ